MGKILRSKLFRLALFPAAVAAWLALVLAPSAQAYWVYDYFSGASYQNQYWTSAVGTSEGGQVYAGISGGSYGQNNYEYTATFDAQTGYWLASASGGTGGWTYLTHPAYYSAFDQC
jgi:hypothetical protein